MNARNKAEAMALSLALACERTCLPGLKHVQGREFAAIGGWNARGIWHFAVETRNDEEKAEVAAWVEAHR